MAMRKFSDFAQDANLSGVKTPMAGVLGKEIIVSQFRVFPTKFPNQSGHTECLQLQFSFAESGQDLRVLFTNSDVLLKQAREYADEMPFSTVIRKVNRYFTFT